MSGSVLTALRLSHFRSHRDTRLALDGRPVAIHGPNGAGKTNILEAVSLLSPGRGLRRARTAELSRRPEELGWKVAAVLHSPARPHEIETWAEPVTSRKVLIDGKPAPQVALGRLARILWLVPAMDRLWIEGAEGRRRYLDRMALSFTPGHAEAALRYERAMRERNRLLRDGGDAGWLDALEMQMAEAGAEITANRRTALARISAAARAATTSFPVPDLSLADPAPDTPQVLAAALAQGRARDVAAGRTLTGPHLSDLDAVYRAKNVSARDCSTGEQKALLVSLILANARALMDGAAPPILLLDEVAAHLDADRRAALYDEILALGAQALLTGTGKDLFDAMGERAQYLEVCEIDGVSEVRPG